MKKIFVLLCLSCFLFVGCAGETKKSDTGGAAKPAATDTGSDEKPAE